MLYVSEQDGWVAPRSPTSQPSVPCAAPLAMTITPPSCLVRPAHHPGHRAGGAAGVLPTERLLLQFLCAHLPVDELEQVVTLTPNSIENADIWQGHGELLELWDLLHFSTQERLVAQLRRSLFRALADAEGFLL